MTNILRGFRKNTAILLGIMLVVGNSASTITIASEQLSFSAEPEKADIVSVELPTFSEDAQSPFDFILDPQGLIYATDAARYGGGSVEEAATLYFHNRDGEYDFSSVSDKLTVTNKSTVPVRATVTVKIKQIENVHLIAEKGFEDKEQTLWLAVVDDRGNEQPIMEEQETTIVTELKAASAGAYVYRYDEETQTYQYELNDGQSESLFDTYSFGLTGACNPEGDWSDEAARIVVNVTWNVEPIGVSEPRQEGLDPVDTDKSLNIVEEGVEQAVEQTEVPEIETQSTELQNTEDSDGMEQGLPDGGGEEQHGESDMTVSDGDVT